MKERGFPRALRIRRRADFLRVQNRGQKHHVRHFLVFVVRGDLEARGFSRSVTDSRGTRALPPARLGVTVTRKVGSAVVRNRIKRLVRESFRRERKRFPPGLSMVWVAKRSIGTLTFSEVLEQMQTLARRLSRPPRNHRREVRP